MANLVRSIFNQTMHETAQDRLDEVVETLRDSHPRVAEMLVEAEVDILAYAAFPSEHWRKLCSNNPLKRLNRQIKRRTDMVGTFPNRKAVTRLVGAVLMEQDDEWLAGRRYISTASMKRIRLLTREVPHETEEEVTAA